MAGNRRKFACWQCKRQYSLYQEITDQQELIVPCPYCGAEAVVKLEPYKKEITTILRGGNEAGPAAGCEYQFPEVIPTQPPEKEQG